MISSSAANLAAEAPTHTVEAEYGDVAAPVPGVSCSELVQELWGPEAGGRDTIAGSPRGRAMTLADANKAVIRLQALLTPPKPPETRPDGGRRLDVVSIRLISDRRRRGRLIGRTLEGKIVLPARGTAFSASSAREASTDTDVVVVREADRHIIARPFQPGEQAALERAAREEAAAREKQAAEATARFTASRFASQMRQASAIKALWGDRPCRCGGQVPASCLALCSGISDEDEGSLMEWGDLVVCPSCCHRFGGDCPDREVALDPDRVRRVIRDAVRRVTATARKMAPVLVQAREALTSLPPIPHQYGAPKDWTWKRRAGTLSALSCRLFGGIGATDLEEQVTKAKREIPSLKTGEFVPPEGSLALDGEIKTVIASLDEAVRKIRMAVDWSSPDHWSYHYGEYVD